MDTTAEFKFTKIGKIPADWKIEELKNISEIITGSTPKTNRNEFWNGDYMFVTPSDINGNKYMSSTERYVTEEALKISRAIPENSIMVTCIASIGKMAISKEKCMTNQQINSIIPINSCDSQYLYYYLLKNKPMLELLASQTTVPIINKSTFSKIKIMVPPLKEQQKIAEILSTVDEQIEQTDQLIEKTKELKKGLMQQLLIKGIRHTEFKHTELGEIPVEWEVKMLPDLVTSEKNAIKIGPFGSQLKKELLVEYGYKVYGQENIIAKDFNKGSRFLTPEHFNKLKTSELKAGDFVITMMGTIGKCGVFPDNALPGIMDSHLLRIRLNKELYTNELLLHVINSDLVQKQLKNLSVGGIMAGLSSKTVKKILLPVPSIEEQQKIAEILSSIDEDIEGYQEEKIKYEELKKGLMQQLLTGKTRVNVD